MDRFGMVPERIFDDPRIHLRALRLFGKICSRAVPDPEGRLDPNQFRVAFAWNAELADAIGIDPRGVSTETKTLQLGGYILIERGRHGGRGTKYIVLMSCQGVRSRQDVSYEQPKVTSGRAKTTRQGMTKLTSGRDQIQSPDRTEILAPCGSESRARTRESALQPYPKNQGHLKLPITGGGASATSAKQFHQGGTNGQTRIPVDWQPNDDELEYARRAGWDDQRIEREIERYRNYRPPPGRVVTWGRWVDKADQQFDSRGGPAGSTGQRPEGTLANVSAVMSRWPMDTRQAGD